MTGWTVEEAWVKWASAICRTGDDHQPVCVGAQDQLRVASETRWNQIVAPGLRWPGYLGRDYERGGVLSVGIVYTSFATGGLVIAPEVPAALAAHEAWTTGNMSDGDWLAAIRSMYRKGLTWRRNAKIGWDVATFHHQYWDGLGESVDSVAYVNAMRCQYPGDQPSPTVQNRCLAELPLTDLITVLEPRLVLSNSEQAKKQLEAIVPTLYINQRGGGNLRQTDLVAPAGVATIPKGKVPDTLTGLVRAGFGRPLTP